MVYLLGVAFVAARHGRLPSVLASILSVAAFDFFFVPPHLTFAVSDTQYVITFAVMLGWASSSARSACASARRRRRPARASAAPRSSTR